MSWDSYLDNLVAQSKDGSGTCHIDKACIIGKDGSKWTTDGHPCALKLTPKEAQDIGGSLNKKNFTTLQANGIRCEGTKYQFLREIDDKCVLGKKKEQGAVSIQGSKTAVVIGHCPEGCQQGNANKAVATIAEYLESLGM